MRPSTAARRSFVSAYNWKEGIGDPDADRLARIPVWKGIEHNDVGSRVSGLVP